AVVPRAVAVAVPLLAPGHLVDRRGLLDRAAVVPQVHARVGPAWGRVAAQRDHAVPAHRGGSEGLQFGNVVAARTPYRNASGGMDQVFTYVFATAPVALAGKPIASVTLPASVNGGELHVFAVATG